MRMNEKWIIERCKMATIFVIATFLGNGNYVRCVYMPILSERYV